MIQLSKDRGHRAATVFVKSLLRAAKGKAKAFETATVPELAAPPIEPCQSGALSDEEWAKAEALYHTLEHEGEGFGKARFSPRRAAPQICL